MQIMLWRCGARAVSTLGQLAISPAPKTHVKSQVSGVKNKNQTKTTTYLNEVLVSYLMEGFDKVSTSLEGNLPSAFQTLTVLLAFLAKKKKMDKCADLIWRLTRGTKMWSVCMLPYALIITQRSQ